MIDDEVADKFVVILREYFSQPIAKAIVSSAIRKERISTALDPDSAMQLATALARTLPSYLSDVERRIKCVDSLRRAAKSAGSLQVPKLPKEWEVPPSVIVPSAGIANGDTTLVRIDNADDVLNAAEAARDLCRQIGFSMVEQTKIATVVAELSRNIQLYVGCGEIRLGVLETPKRGILVLAVDEGPGILDVEAVMRDDFKSRTGMGMGLRGTKRIMDEFEIDTRPGLGTRVTSRKYVK